MWGQTNGKSDTLYVDGDLKFDNGVNDAETFIVSNQDAQINANLTWYFVNWTGTKTNDWPAGKIIIPQNTTYHAGTTWQYLTS
jgi:hypothetical protein